MAENEAKPERKQVEMSIWFIILLIVVIVFMCVFMSMNKKLGEAQEKITGQETTIANLEKERDNNALVIKDLTEQISKGNITNNQILEKLNSLGYTTESILGIGEQPSEVVSGDAISGEVAE